MKVYELQRGEALVHMGDAAESLFLIAEGSIQAWMIKGGKKVSLGTIDAGSVCGEVPLFIGIKKRTADLIASSPTRIVEIKYDLLKDIQEKNSDVGRRIDALYQHHLLERQIALNPFFQSLPMSFRQKIAQEMTGIRVRADGVLFNEGDESSDLYLIRSGSLGIYANIRGIETLLQVVKAGVVVGEVAIGNNGRRSVTVKAVTDSVLMRWKSEDYQNMYQKHEILQDIVAKHHALQNEQIASATHPAAESGGDNSELIA